MRRELERVLASSGFARNERQSQFLRFLVERHLDGRDSELKESVIAVEVFGRNADYDPKIDAIVRTEAVRLRARLDKYYAVEGSGDPLVIELPKGGYKPVFRERVALATCEPSETDPPVAGPSARAPHTGARRLVARVAAIVLITLSAVLAWWWVRAAQFPVAVGVLPLENFGSDPANEYLADGLTDDIIGNLSVIEGLTVRSRTSSFALKGQRPTAAQAGKQLGADFLVGGSVLRAGDQLRVNANLVRVRDDVVVWSERFDRKLTDVFAIQDDISRGIVNTLRLKLPGRRRYETDLEAYDFYLRGRHAMTSFPGPGGGRRPGNEAMAYFNKAIEKDANYAIAYAGLADAFLAISENILSPEAFRQAKAAAARAVDLDPMLSEAQSAQASVRAAEYLWHDAERGFRRAIELNPNNALAHLALGGSVLVVQERFEDGLAEVRRATTLDPLSPYAATEAGRALLLAHRYPDAVAELRRAIALDPSRSRPYSLLGRALYLQGNTAEALKIFDEQASRANSAWRTCAEVRAGREPAAISSPALAPRPGAAPQEGVRFAAEPGAGWERNMARHFACLRDEEHTLEFLTKVIAERQLGLADTLQAPELAWMRGSPRFAALRKELNLPQ